MIYKHNVRYAKAYTYRICLEIPTNSLMAKTKIHKLNVVKQVYLDSEAVVDNRLILIYINIT